MRPFRQSFLVNNFADFLYSAGKKMKSSVIGGISLQQHLRLSFKSVFKIFLQGDLILIIHHALDA